jgi:hypothetical protein
MSSMGTEAPHFAMAARSALVTARLEINLLLAYYDCGPSTPPGYTSPAGARQRRPATT